MSRPQWYSGAMYIWSLAQTARAAHLYPNYPPTWQGIEALQRAVQLSGKPVPREGPWNMQWARVAFADADARFNFKYEQVPA